MVIKEDWFQFAVVKMVTLAAVAAKESENTVDDALVGFIKRNKQPILTIIKKEVNLNDTPIDNMLLKAINDIS